MREGLFSVGSQNKKIYNKNNIIKIKVLEGLYSVGRQNCPQNIEHEVKLLLFVFLYVTFWHTQKKGLCACMSPLLGKGVCTCISLFGKSFFFWQGLVCLCVTFWPCRSLFGNVFFFGQALCVCM